MAQRVFYPSYMDNRLMSGKLWWDCPLIYPGEHQFPNGVLWRDDFHGAGSAESSTAYGWTGPQGLRYIGFGTLGVLMAASDGGTGQDTMIGELVVTTDADNEEAYVTLDPTYHSALFQPSDTAGDALPFWYETRVKFSNVTGTNGMNKFIGLVNPGEAVTGSLTATAQAFTSALGFHAVEATANVMIIEGVVGGTPTTLKAAAKTLTADTYVRFGIKFDGRYVSFYLDGEPVSDATEFTPATTGIPDAAALMPFWGVLCGLSGTGAMTVDGWVGGAMYE